MSSPGKAPRRVVRQALLAAGVGAFAYAEPTGSGMILLLALAAWWPPEVAWLPCPAFAIMRAYLVFAPCWLLGLWLYLQALAAIGHPVVPQDLLQRLAADGLHSNTAIAAVLLAVLLAPVVEELLFRGYFYTAFRTRYPAVVALPLTAALFGLAHGLAYALPVAVLGYWFGCLREQHRALLPAVFAHALHNGCTVALVLCWPAHLEWLYPR